MALLVECPKCKRRSSVETKECKRCAFKLGKATGKVYWIEYYIDGQRKRERIGPNKEAAEQRLREVLKLRTEERYIDKNKNARVTLNELSNWYLDLPQIKAKRSYDRDKLSINTFSSFFAGKLIRDLTNNQIEAYRQKRLEEVSHRGQMIQTAIINREIGCLRHMLNLAEKEGKTGNESFDELSNWYLDLPQIKAKHSYDRNKLFISTLLAFFAGKSTRDLTETQIESYRQKRIEGLSQRGLKIRPATINREIACLRHMLNLAESEGKIETVPFKRLKALKENNIRDRILTHEEYVKLLENCLPHTAQVVKMAYYTGMRQGEILNLTWDRVDLQGGFVHLKPEDTKTNEGRSVPLHPAVAEMISSMPRTIHGRVFTLDGSPLGEVKRSFKTACKTAGIENFTFNDLRHTCLNNWRLQGHDFFRIMAASGHRTMEVFKRYNTVTQEELKRLVSGTMDTYMDTNEKRGQAEIA